MIKGAGKRITPRRRTLGRWVVLLGALMVCVPLNLWGEIIVLRSGKRIFTPHITDTGTHLQYVLHGRDTSVAKSDVRHIVSTIDGKTVILPVAPAAPTTAAPSVPSAPPKARTPAPPATQKQPAPPAPKPAPPTPEKTPAPSKTAPGETTGTTEAPLVGFRGLRWDLRLPDLAEAKYIATEPVYGGVTLYRNLADSLRVGDLLLEEIVYGFRGEQFYNLTLWIATYNGFQTLRDSVFNAYGRGLQNDLSLERYVWQTDHTDVLLYYDAALEKGMLWFRNRDLHRRLQATNR